MLAGNRMFDSHQAGTRDVNTRYELRSLTSSKVRLTAKEQMPVMSTGMQMVFLCEGFARFILRVLMHLRPQPLMLSGEYCSYLPTSVVKPSQALAKRTCNHVQLMRFRALSTHAWEQLSSNS